jgi:lysozyme
MAGPFEKNVAGFDGFIWFMGIVESRQDPLALSRVQVRCFNVHSASLTDIPSVDLPWATVMQSALSAPPLALKENDVVFGFFADGRSCQTPVILGILPGFQVETARQGLGFSDQRSNTDLQSAPRKPQKITYNVDGSGVVITNSNTASLYPINADLDKPSLSGATRYDIANTVINTRKTNLDKGVVTATGLTWDEPYPAYNPLYPYNKAYETESGHLIEYDDTPNQERITFTHRSGSFLDFYPTGTRVEKITRSGYSITMGDDFVHVMGRCLITVGEGAYVKILGDANIECGNNLNVGVAGDANFSVGGSFNIKAKSYNANIDDTATMVTGFKQFFTSQGDVHINAQGTNFLTAAGQLELFCSGAVDIQGSEINCELGAQEAQIGTGNSIAAAPAVATPNKGQAPLETTPVPFPQNFTQLDSDTGVAYKQSQFLDNGQPPDSNANGTSMTCNFDPNTKTFLPSDSWTISSDGLDKLQIREGLAKVLANGMVQCYPDPATGSEPITVGFGTTQSVLTTIDPNVVLTLQFVTTKQQCSTWLENALDQIFIPKLKEYITVDLTQNQVDALLSFMYNVGVGNFASSTLRKDVNTQSWCKAGDDFLMWNKAAGKVVPGIVKRREDERTQFLG